MINNFIAYSDATYIGGLTVCFMPQKKNIKEVWQYALCLKNNIKAATLVMISETQIQSSFLMNALHEIISKFGIMLQLNS